jgi:hypothetical protein
MPATILSMRSRAGESHSFPIVASLPLAPSPSGKVANDSVSEPIERGANLSADDG